MGHSTTGALAAALGVLMFGTNYIPVRKYEMYDGAMFQWMMNSGLLCVGIISQFLFGGEVNGYGLLGGAILATQNFLVLPVVKLLGLGVGFSLYHIINLCVGYAVGRFGLFGAPIDVASNSLLRDLSVLVLIISFIFMMRVEPDMQASSQKNGSSTKLDESDLGTIVQESEAVMPSASGQIELTTIRPEQIEPAGGGPASPVHSVRSVLSNHSAQRSVGSSHSVLALTLGLSDSVADEVEQVAEAIAGTMNDATQRPYFFAGMRGAAGSRFRRALAPGSQEQQEEGERDSWADAVEEGDSVRLASGAPASDAPADGAQAPAQTCWQLYRVRVIGVFLAILAGTTCGLNAVPYDVWTNTVRAHDVSPLTFVFSQSLGGYAAGTAFYFLYRVFALARRVRVEHSPVLPAYIAGFMWGTGLAAQFIAIEELGMAEAYVICAIGPVMVSALISALVFGEIRGRENTRDFIIALTLQCTGVVMLALGS